MPHMRADPLSKRPYTYPSEPLRPYFRTPFAPNYHQPCPAMFPANFPSGGTSYVLVLSCLLVSRHFEPPTLDVVNRVVPRCPETSPTVCHKHKQALSPSDWMGPSSTSLELASRNTQQQLTKRPRGPRGTLGSRKAGNRAGGALTKRKLWPNAQHSVALGPQAFNTVPSFRPFATLHMVPKAELLKGAALDRCHGLRGLFRFVEADYAKQGKWQWKICSYLPSYPGWSIPSTFRDPLYYLAHINHFNVF
ncbi:uncharacterized protein CLUP02_08945 [Colletotrichum lupini]|uniref:Uncharacterized protein n=1 Tax=Colletotrichum lupini TaxID=145971 RepID=A0A9Q8WI43_9PEZI|nr:uncharacterized protein CLUP02_08945 [Colletotrichum lupini]UQC83450.1 hypothetical protein CLUP02_08945 [Colletotrichum lupini]